MGDHYANESSSSSSAFGESSNSTVELNIKTLDCQNYSFQVEKTMSVLSFKEKVAARVGIPVGQQRLIFRGKLLKDEHTLSEYQVENGDTLHLVERQQAQPQSDTTTGETSENSDNSGTNHVPHNRIGQIAHSVVLGTLNVGGQGETMAPDVGQVIGAVLNSIGIGQTGANVTSGPMSFTPPNGSGQVSVGNWNGGAQSQGGTQVLSGQAFLRQPFQSMPQVVQIPLPSAAIPVPLSSLPTRIPDSLNTMSEFMNRMEQALTEDGYQPNSHSTVIGDIPNVELPSNAQGLPTAEALSIVMRHAQQLLNSRASAALSHLAGRLEQDGTSSDSATRSQIQTEAMQLGLAMQHIGTLLLELGRTIMTLQMGQSSAEPFVYAGPAVYISPTGPNPIMVQPSPLLTSPFFGGPIPSFSPVTSGPVGIGNPPRNVNIHIHAGTSLAPVASTVGSRTSGDGPQRDSGNAAGSGEAGAARVLPVRVATAVPLHPTGVAISSAAQPNLVVSTSQPSAPQSSGLRMHFSPVVTDPNGQLRNLVGNMQRESQDQPRSTPQNLAVGSSAEVEQRSSSSPGVQEPDASLPKCTDQLGQKVSTREDSSNSSSKDITVASSGELLGDSSKGTVIKIDDASKVMRSNEKNDTPRSARSPPLGLGLGGLDRKRLRKQPKSNGAGATSALPEGDQNAGVGQQVLQALASFSSSTNQRDLNNLPSGQSSLNMRQSTETNVSDRQVSDVSSDMASAMSQVLQNPSLNGLLAGVSGQSGVGSSDALRTMMQQFTQTPAMMNAISQIAQQVDEQEIENMFSGAGRNQGGGLDLSGMIQQMMPVVSRALSGSQNSYEQSPILVPEHHQQQERVTRDNKFDDEEVNLQEVVQRIQHMNAPEEIFRSMIEYSVQLYGSERVPEDFIDELCRDKGLARAYVEMLVNDLSSRPKED